MSQKRQNSSKNGHFEWFLSLNTSSGHQKLLLEIAYCDQMLPSTHISTFPQHRALNLVLVESNIDIWVIWPINNIVILGFWNKKNDFKKLFWVNQQIFLECFGRVESIFSTFRGHTQCYMIVLDMFSLRKTQLFTIFWLKILDRGYLWDKKRSFDAADTAIV